MRGRPYFFLPLELPLELPLDEPPPLEEPPPPEEELLELELLELELLEVEPPLEDELLELEDPPPEEETAGSPRSARACWRCTTTLLTDGPKVDTATMTASPIAAAINAYSTAAAPAVFLTISPRPPEQGLLYHI
jgi:hypothetical protein